MPSVADILSGPIAQTLGGDFESRPEQIEMAAAVVRAMEQRSHLLVEAGTGVGKSFAYLVPAILRACGGETVVIATNTIQLQEQLIQKDIPLLQGALEAAGIIPESSDAVTQQRSDAARKRDSDAVTQQRSDAARKEEKPKAEQAGSAASLRDSVAVPLRPVLVKGRGNYVSIRRLAQASKRQDRLFADAAARRTLHVIEDWATDTLDGSLSSLPAGGLERPGVWDKVQSDSGNCMGRRCPNYQACFYQRARREMEGANLLVTNHALFFSDLALRGKEVGFLPAYQHVVLDEAHNVEDVAADHFGVSLSEGRVMHLLSTLYHAKSGKGYLPQLQVVVGDAGEVDRAVRLVLGAENAARAFFDDLLQIQRSGTARNGRVREAGVVENGLTPAMRELSLRLKGLREGLKGEGVEPDRYELNAYAQRAEMIALEAEILVDQKAGDGKGYAYWIEVRGDEDELGRRGFGAKVTFACSPIEVAPILKEKLFGGEQSVVLTSATLGTGKSETANQRVSESGKAKGRGAGAFGHVMTRLGCEGAATLMLGSPFDHAAQVELFIEREMARPDAGARAGGFTGGRASTPPDDLDQRPRDPDDDSAKPRGRPFTVSPSHRFTPTGPSPGYNSQLSSRILHHIDATNGGAFVLFTSFATLYAVADLLGPELEDRGMPMLVQGRDGPRSLILQRFRDNERSVLLGAASFWQGVDVRGRGLRNVIITKLPFEPPDRPLTEARCEAIKEKGGDPFRDDSLPRAVLKFKQGFGRLIRSKTDKGRVVVLDPRVLTAGYGRAFLDALPAGVRVMDSA